MASQTPVPGCVHHQGTGYVYVCLDCNDELICTRCVVDKHNGHKIVVVDDVVSDKKVELQQYMDRVSKTTNPNLQGEITLTEDKIKENGKTFRKMIADIKGQAQKMKQEIDKCADKLIQLCCELEKSNEEMLKSYKCALESLKDENNRGIDDCKQTLKSGTIVELMEKAKETNNTTSISPVPEKIKNVQFQPGPILVSQLQHLLGFLTVDGEDQQYRPIIIPTVVSEFKHKAFVTKCQTTLDNNAWFSCFKVSDIYRLDQRGKVKETLQCKAKVRYTAISPITERVWFCCRDDRTIREVVDDNSIVTRFITDSKPWSLCITTNDAIVVGMDWKIVMYTADGQEIESAGAEGPCREEARQPLYMACCTMTGNVVVSDSDNVTFGDYIAGKKPGKQPHIKVMDKYLNVRFRYPWQDNTDVDAHARSQKGEQQLLFYPHDVSFDETGNILVADEASKSIILIDGYRGDYIRTVYTDDFTIWSISLQKDGFLWVGMEQKKVKILKYK